MSAPPSSPRAPDAQSPTREAAQVFLRRPAALAGLVLFALIVGLSLLGPVLYEADPFDIASAPLTPPWSSEAWLGSDQQGRDVLTGLVYGGRATLAVGATAAGIAVLIGVTVGALAGYFGGVVDEMLMRIAEFFQVLPALLFAMVLATLFSPSLVVISLAIGVVSWPPTARLTRAEFLKLRELDFVAAERVIGASTGRILWKAILPNALPPLIVSATFAIGTAILFEASLSFLGLGDPNRMSWGLMIGAGRSYMLTCWWAVTFPGLMIFLAVLAISLIGDGLNDALNPKLRERR
ncbi:MAG: ABC transporter permease [Hyphomicrobiaceae bacterium]|nr:ABC transporter permease [Hyphomicrobiaceae bacterium]